jgi:ubiquinone biosynthesis protein UbiJ
VTTRYERIKMQRRMQRRIRLVVEERRMALTTAFDQDADTTVEITPRAIGRVSIRQN